ncbi:hypothetical protein G6011_11306 [Alternaria panax]|uniref:Protein kinase domain-containing protein n=1 Tax=Alternaria panax TaxID=48097 RepID=A0AAD4IDH0_9PLEO|nr:hypothetical protein G6011_11306 [Alternaria panax]
MALPPNVPKSAIDKYVPIKLISENANGLILAVVPKNIVNPTLSSLLALTIPRPKEDLEALLGQFEFLLDIKTRRLVRVIDCEPKGNWYITPFYHGHDLQHLKKNHFQDGFPPFLVFKIFVEVTAAQGTELGPKGICHADLRGSNVIISPTQKEELPIVRIVHLEGIAVWNEQAIVRQVIGLLRYLTNSVSRIPDKYRTNKMGDKLENIIEDKDTNSLIIGDDFYSFIANFDLEGIKSWKDLKSMWVNEATGLMSEFYDKGLLADVKEVIGEQKVTMKELKNVMEDGGMNYIDDRDL